MTLDDLKARIAVILHRSDLTAQMDNFISDAQLRIERRFGIVLPAIDPIPAQTELLFQYAALTSAYEHLNNGENAQYYFDKFELEADRQNVLNPGTITDNFAGTTPAILSEAEQNVT
jgi:hypothetical protein